MRYTSKLHYITTNAMLAEQACKAGVDWIQLRLKNVTYADYKAVALEVQEVCRVYNSKLIINDDVALAQEINADGVHLGKEDMPPAEARAFLGDTVMIGCTANTIDDVLRLSKEDIDYIGLGPYRFTTTKEKLSPVLGLEGYKNIISQIETNIPLIAIGGITIDDVEQLLDTGLHGIAVSGAISNAQDVQHAAKTFLNTVQKELVR